MFKENIIHVMCDATNSSRSFQSTIRAEWANHDGCQWDKLIDICDAMATYRQYQEEMIQAEDDDNKASLRKSVNNVIGDVARIVRELTDGEYTIKCTKKKPVYVYEPVKRDKVEEDKSEESDKSEEDEAIAFTTVADEVKALVDKYGLEAVASEIANLIKVQKDSEE